MKRCEWHNLDKSEIYQHYHDTEWGVASFDDGYLFEMLVLESFHCGLSWLIILKKREAFRLAFDNFDPLKISVYGEEKIAELLENKGIVRNKTKILATIENAKAFLKIVKKYGSFSAYIWSFTNNKVVHNPFDGKTSSSELSDAVAKSLKSHGFKFMGTVTTFSYLEAIGVQNNHAVYCEFYQGDKQ